MRCQAVNRKFYNNLVPWVLSRYTISEEATPKFYFMFPHKRDTIFTFSIAKSEWREHTLSEEIEMGQWAMMIRTPRNRVFAIGGIGSKGTIEWIDTEEPGPTKIIRR